MAERRLHLGEDVPVRERDEGVRERAVDAQLAGDAHPSDPRVEVDRVVEQRVEAADEDVRRRQPLQRGVGREDGREERIAVHPRAFVPLVVRLRVGLEQRLRQQHVGGEGRARRRRRAADVEHRAEEQHGVGHPRLRRRRQRLERLLAAVLREQQREDRRDGEVAPRRQPGEDEGIGAEAELRGVRPSRSARKAVSTCSWPRGYGACGGSRTRRTRRWRVSRTQRWRKKRSAASKSVMNAPPGTKRITGRAGTSPGRPGTSPPPSSGLMRVRRTPRTRTRR